MRPRPRPRNARLPRPHCTRKLYEIPAVTLVDGLPPAPSSGRWWASWQETSRRTFWSLLLG
eukprot:3272567-Pyramimonas_sp.AAC.1